MIELSDYQKDAVRILFRKGRHILGDDYGVGKSYPAIEAAWCAAGSRPKLIVCPAYLIKNWVRYIREMYVDPNEPVIYTSEGYRHNRIAAVNAEEIDWLIVSYSVLALCKKPDSPYKSLITRRWYCVIYDEAHRLRGRNSKSTWAAHRVHCEYVFFLTADPIVRDAGDVFPLLKIIEPKRFTSYWRFVGHHCRMEITPWSRKPGALYHPEEFYDMLSQYMTRRLPSEVGLEFPTEMPTEILIDMSPSIRKTYSKAKESWRIEHEDLPRAKYIKSGGALVHELRALTGSPPGKENPKAKVVKEILVDKFTKHVAVYCWYKASAQVLLDQVPDRRPKFLVTGSVPSNKRDDIVQEWQESGNGVMVATLGSLTEGCNLQFCNHVIFYEEDWIPKTMQQALGRFIRRGALSSEVYTWYLRVKASVDCSLYTTQQRRNEQNMGALMEQILEVEDD